MFKFKFSNILPVLTLTSFNLAIYNTINSVKSRQIRDELIKERMKNKELQDKIDMLTSQKMENIENVNNQNKVLLDNIKEIVNPKSNDSSSNFTDLSNYFDSLQQFINSLNFEQTLAILHITGSVFILISLFSITTILYGNYFIEYFELEIKYPKLAKLIRIRRKVKKIELIITSILIIYVLLATIYVNIFILLN
jgi:hypothetical protein